MYLIFQKTGFLEEMAPEMAPSGNDWAGLTGADSVVVLTDSSIGSFIKEQESALIMFYAPCKIVHCIMNSITTTRILCANLFL